MKYTATYIIMLWLFGCGSEKVPVKRESNFNIIVATTDEYGDEIDLKEGTVVYPRRQDLDVIHLNLTEQEWDGIFQSVPWDELQSLDNYYEPQGKNILNSGNYDKITFINGKLKKTIMIRSWAKFTNTPQLIEKIKSCIAHIHQTVRMKTEVKPLKRLVCGFGY